MFLLKRIPKVRNMAREIARSRRKTIHTCFYSLWPKPFRLLLHLDVGLKRAMRYQATSSHIVGPRVFLQNPILGEYAIELKCREAPLQTSEAIYSSQCYIQILPGLWDLKLLRKMVFSKNPLVSYLFLLNLFLLLEGVLDFGHYC